MAVLDKNFWEERASTATPSERVSAQPSRGTLVTVTASDGPVFGEMETLSPCHYREYWQDRYAREMRERAMKKMFPSLPLFADGERAVRVLDVGCGDGRFGEWVGENFDAVVSGVDAFKWRGAYRRLQRFAICDAENVSEVALKWGFFDVALLVTVLPFVGDFKKVLEELTWVCPFVLVIDNLQAPAPRWQTGLGYKRHITRTELFEAASEVGYGGLAFSMPVNFVDRALFVRSPRWLFPLTYTMTRALDALALKAYEWGWLSDRHARYQAALLENKQWDKVMERWTARKG